MDRAAMTVGVTGELNDITVLELTGGRTSAQTALLGARQRSRLAGGRSSSKFASDLEDS
jgi:hypothetical protein